MLLAARLNLGGQSFSQTLSATAVGTATLTPVQVISQTISATAIGVATVATSVTIAGASKALTRLLTLLGVR